MLNMNENRFQIKLALAVVLSICLLLMSGAMFKDIEAMQTEVTPTSVTLYWTSPGDDNTDGVAWSYDIRYSTSTITAESWEDATQATGEPHPQSAGTTQQFTINDLIPDTDYYFAIRTVDESNNWSGISNVVYARTLELSLEIDVPDNYQLEQNYPNPFNASTLISYYVPASEHVTVAIYDILGRKISILVDDQLAAGDYVTSWDGLDGDGRTVASGVYLYRLHAGDHRYSRKMILMK